MTAHASTDLATTGNESFAEMLQQFGVTHEEDLAPSAIQIVRQRQIFRVLDLMEHEHLSVRQACERIGIKPRTFERWLAQDDLLKEVSAMTRQAIGKATLTAVAALPEATAHMARIATGQVGHPADALRASKMLESYLRTFLSALPAPEPEQSDEFNPSFTPLSGPQTRKVTIELEGMKITREEGQAPIIEMTGERPTVLDTDDEAGF